MYCPVCGAEYRPGFTVCSDCQVDLAPDPPRNPSANPPIDDKADDTSFVVVWSGSDARRHAEICEVLDRQKIPARTLGSEDHLFNLTTRPAFEVYVPVELVNPAREALHQAVPTEEDSEPLSDSEQLLDSGILEIPAEEGPPDENDNQNNDAERSDRNLDPQDVTVEIWSGQDFDTAAMIASSLRENHIPCRSDSQTTESQDESEEMNPKRILVLPEDEKRGKEIVREIVDAVPPE